MINVLFIWKVREELRSHLRKGLAGVEGINLIFPGSGNEDEEDIPEEELTKNARKADIIVGWRPTKEILTAAKNLKLVINPGAGVQHLTKLFRELRSDGREIPLVNGHGNAYYTAQGAVALLLSFMNKTIPHHNWMREGKWRLLDDKAKSLPLRHRRIGFVGYGHVNRHIHRFLANFEIEFHALRKDWSKLTDEPPTELRKYHPEDIKEMIGYVDILIVTLPSTSETIDLIGEEELELLGKEGILVHIGRGKVIQENALYNALKQSTIKGAVIDVWYEYRPEPDDEGRRFPYHFPFHELDNVVMSPHRCASPFDDLERWDDVVRNIKRVHAGEKDFENLVDVEAGY
jgi:phosphoglycerate dehydrogenase-like enzyme